MIVCIPTKGRPGTKFYEILDKAGIEYRHFIEPQEEEIYKEIPNTVSIKNNDKGISYVRNFMLNWCKENGHRYVWFCDDDIKGFTEYKEGKNRKLTGNILRLVLDQLKDVEFTLAGFNYGQYTWTAKEDVSLNSTTVEVCVLMDLTKIKHKYNQELDTKEDRDFLMQVLEAGGNVIRFNKIGFTVPNVGSNKGGLQESYQSKKDEEKAKMLLEKWHPYAKATDKKGRKDTRLLIKKYAKSRNMQVI